MGAAEEDMASDEKSVQLKSDALMEQMKLHLTTDAGKALTKKIGLVYQLNIAPKVRFSSPCERQNSCFLLCLHLAFVFLLFHPFG